MHRCISPEAVSAIPAERRPALMLHRHLRLRSSHFIWISLSTQRIEVSSAVAEQVTYRMRPVSAAIQYDNSEEYNSVKRGFGSAITLGIGEASATSRCTRGIDTHTVRVSRSRFSRHSDPKSTSNRSRSERLCTCSWSSVGILNQGARSSSRRRSLGLRNGLLVPLQRAPDTLGIAQGSKLGACEPQLQYRAQELSPCGSACE